SIRKKDSSIASFRFAHASPTCPNSRISAAFRASFPHLPLPHRPHFLLHGWGEPLILPLCGEARHSTPAKTPILDPTCPNSLFSAASRGSFSNCVLPHRPH